MSVHEHKKQAPSSVRVFVITVSDTRTEEDDTSGQLICQALHDVGHCLSGYTILKDEPDQVETKIREVVSSESTDVILINGGTGLSHRDRTYEAVCRVLDKRLDGFGELFRSLSYQEIGPAAMLSRAVAGAVGSVAVFSMPGSRDAVKLALDKLILPELGHTTRELRR